MNLEGQTKDFWKLKSILWEMESDHLQQLYGTSANMVARSSLRQTKIVEKDNRMVYSSRNSASSSGNSASSGARNTVSASSASRPQVVPVKKTILKKKRLVKKRG